MPLPPPVVAADEAEDPADIFGDELALQEDRSPSPAGDDEGDRADGDGSDSDDDDGTSGSEPDSEDAGFIINLRTGVYHALSSPGALKCGLPLPRHWSPADFTAALAHESRKCRRCFG